MKIKCSLLKKENLILLQRKTELCHEKYVNKNNLTEGLQEILGKQML